MEDFLQCPSPVKNIFALDNELLTHLLARLADRELSRDLLASATTLPNICRLHYDLITIQLFVHLLDLRGSYATNYSALASCKYCPLIKMFTRQ